MTSSYIAVNNIGEFDILLDGAGGFHDAIVREAAFVARGYVDEHHEMWGDTDPADLILFIQLQSPARPGVELLLTGASLCIITTAATTMEPEIDFSVTGVSLYLEGRSRRDTSLVVAAGLWYRFLDEQCLGAALRWSRPLPRP